MKSLSTIKEEQLNELEQRFGGEGRYLCQWNENMNAWTSCHEDVKALLLSAIEGTAQAMSEAVKISSLNRLDMNREW